VVVPVAAGRLERDGRRVPARRRTRVGGCGVAGAGRAVLSGRAGRPAGASVGGNTVTDGMDEVGATRRRAGRRPRPGIVAVGSAVTVAGALLFLLVPALPSVPPASALPSVPPASALSSDRLAPALTTVEPASAATTRSASGVASRAASASPVRTRPTSAARTRPTSAARTRPTSAARTRPTSSLRAHASAAAPPVVREVPLTGPVDPFVARMVKRGIDRAATDHDAAVLLRIDTPGGLDSSMRDIVKAIQRSRVPVICWVGPPGARAASAGTFILIGCPVAAMAPGTNVGAAHPVGITGDVMSEKVTNDAAAYIRSLAESRGRNADWAEKASGAR